MCSGTLGAGCSRHIDYRISMYQPMAHVARHKHRMQEQIYHVLEGEGLMEIAGKNHVVRKHDFIFLPPGVEHAISNSGLVDLVFLVITSPVADDEKPVGADTSCRKNKSSAPDVRCARCFTKPMGLLDQ
jgi:uncharacterized cupin superfamily protein